jgi:DNA-dependent RNA polymerase auxiliary subunit epsilon
MAWRIADNIVRGEIDNQTPGVVQGKIWLAGREVPLALKLTGNSHKDLAGCKLTFSNPAPKVDPSLSLKLEQTGVVGDMTAARRVRVIENLDYEALKDDQPFSEHTANALYLEWFSDSNGRVVIESTDYKIEIGEPAWRLSPEDEARQIEANAEAMQSFMDRITESFDPREEAAYNGDPKDEFEWELFLRASDRRSTKLGELLEKYSDHPDRDRLIARGMGWKEIEEMLDAQAESSGEEEEEEELEFDEPDEEEIARSERPIRHPLVTRIIDRSVELSHLTENQRDDDLDEMIGSYMVVGPKIAGALTIGDRELGPDLNMSGLVVAKLKRAVAELSRAITAANRLRESKRQLPFSIDDCITEMLQTRQEILALMDDFRKKIE